jgi:hypothetical protein
MTKNDLTELIPGYKAPLELITRKSAALPSLSEMRQVALAAEALRAKKTTTAMTTRTTTTPMVSFKTGKMTTAARKETKAASAGAKWFDMRPTPMTDDFKRDVQVLANRAYLDPKRFYKKGDIGTNNTILQRGTVIEGTGEFFSARLSKRQRQANLTDEIMADDKVRRYTKSQFLKIQTATQEKARKRRKRR